MHVTLESLREELDAERAAHAETLRLSQLKDESLARLSHDLRTPMSAILGWANALQLKRADPAILERGIDAISRNALLQARLLDEALETNRLASGKGGPAS